MPNHRPIFTPHPVAINRQFRVPARTKWGFRNRTIITAGILRTGKRKDGVGYSKKADKGPQSRKCDRARVIGAVQRPSARNPTALQPDDSRGRGNPLPSDHQPRRPLDLPHRIEIVAAFCLVRIHRWHLWMGTVKGQRPVTCCGGISPPGIRDSVCRLCGTDEHPLGLGGAVETRFAGESDLMQTGAFHQGQEILSR